MSLDSCTSTATIFAPLRCTYTYVCTPFRGKYQLCAEHAVTPRTRVTVVPSIAKPCSWRRQHVSLRNVHHSNNGTWHCTFTCRSLEISLERNNTAPTADYIAPFRGHVLLSLSLPLPPTRGSQNQAGIVVATATAVEAKEVEGHHG